MCFKLLIFVVKSRRIPKKNYIINKNKNTLRNTKVQTFKVRYTLAHAHIVNMYACVQTLLKRCLQRTIKTEKVQLMYSNLRTRKIQSAHVTALVIYIYLYVEYFSQFYRCWDAVYELSFIKPEKSRNIKSNKE